ncbi:MAG: aminotransferase class V-fold PLP-dependent enzyme [Anaerolineae bacterium]|nr:aminotransferase class V-fold PLP-dependent enzyme [Anaerolineae bacterium]
MTHVQSPHLTYDLDAVRQAFPICTTLTYLNHASISPVPAPTKAAMQTVGEWLTTEPGAFFSPTPPPELGNIFVAFNTEVAALINADDMREIVGVQSTSTAINAIAQAIDWQPGDNIVFSRVEFPSNAYPWMSLQRRGVECRIVPDDGSGGPSVEAFVPYVDDHTRVIAVSAVQFLTGHRADLAALGAFCRARGILFVVDAIQAAGHMPIDVQAMQIDVLASGGQKSLMGPPGQGFLYVRQAVCETLQPALIGPNATVDWMFWLDYDITPEYGAQRFMMGTPNLAGMFGLLASIRFLREIGLPHIDAWTQHLSRYAIDDLTALGYTVITPRDALGPIVTFRIGDPDPDDTAAMQTADTHAADLLAHLTAQGVRLTKHLDARGVPHLRIATHCYNTENEVHRVSAILEETNG